MAEPVTNVEAMMRPEDLTGAPTSANDFGTDAVSRRESRSDRISIGESLYASTIKSIKQDRNKTAQLNDQQWVLQVIYFRDRISQSSKSISILEKENWSVKEIKQDNLCHQPKGKEKSICHNFS